jgi:hypothetical protein
VFLILDVLLEGSLLDSYRGNKASPAPERSCGKLPGLLLEPVGGLALEHLGDVGDGVLGRDNDKEMDMLIANAPGLEDKALPPSNLGYLPLEFGFDEFTGQNLATIPGSPYNMIATAVRTMVQFVAFGA